MASTGGGGLGERQAELLLDPEILRAPPPLRGRPPQGGNRLEIRKLQKVGSSTLSVSLPSGWAAEHGLRRGVSVQLVEDGKELRIIPIAEGAGPVSRETAYLIAADECRSPEVLSRVLISCYVLGRDHVVVRSKERMPTEFIDAVRRTSKKLIGVGIIEESPESIVLQCSIETQRYPVDALFKRLYNLSASAITDSLEALRLKDAKLAHLAASREEDADMIYWLIMRLILSAQQDESVRTLIGLKSRADVAGYSIIAADLERIADQTRIVALSIAWLIEHEVKVPGSVLNTLRQHGIDVAELFADAMLGLLSRDLEKAVEATELAAKLRRSEEARSLAALEGTRDPEALIRLRRIAQAFTLIEESCRQIAIVSFSRHQSEPTRYSRPLDEKKGPSRA